MSVPADNGISTAVACCSDAIVVHSPEYNTITEDRNSSDVPNTLEPTEQTSEAAMIECINHDVNAACSSSYNDRLFVDDSVTLSGLAVDNELEPSVVRVVEPGHPADAADELTTSVAVVTPKAEPVGESLPSTGEHCHSDVVTFNVPLEVIGACWFMKRGTSTCLQATTSKDGSY